MYYIMLCTHHTNVICDWNQTTFFVSLVFPSINIFRCFFFAMANNKSEKEGFSFGRFSPKIKSNLSKLNGKFEQWQSFQGIRFGIVVMFIQNNNKQFESATITLTQQMLEIDTCRFSYNFFFFSNQNTLFTIYMAPNLRIISIIYDYF